MAYDIQTKLQISWCSWNIYWEGYIFLVTIFLTQGNLILHYLYLRVMWFYFCEGKTQCATIHFKVAEHSFSARFCWCKLARAQGFQKTNMTSTERSFYLLNTCTICVIFLYNCMQCIDGSSISLQRYVTKGNDAKNPAFLAFVCYRKNPVKCNACAVARKIETDCFSRNVPFSGDPVIRISRHLAKK